MGVSLPGVAGKDPYRLDRLGGAASVVAPDQRVVLGIGAADRLDRDRLDHERLLGHDEAIALPMGLLESGQEGGPVAEVDDHRRIAAFVSQVGPTQDGDPLVRDALLADLRHRFRCQLVQPLPEPGNDVALEPRLDGGLAQRAQVGETHAEGREHASEGMQEDLGHAERIGDVASMLTAGTAEAAERILGDVIAALGRDLLDRVGHVLDRDVTEPGRHRLRRALVAAGVTDLLSQRRETLAHDLAVQGLVAFGPENRGEIARLDPA